MKAKLVLAMYFLLCSGVGAVMGTGSAMAMGVALPRLMAFGMFSCVLGVCGLWSIGELKFKR